ncbi:patatin-like phospholipase family protein [Eubacteriales bacterium KG127]
MSELVKKARREKVGLVLGGGGARGAYECGVIKAISQLAINPCVVVGTSVGSLIGASYVNDKIDEAIELWKVLETDAVFSIKKNPRSIDYFREFVLRGGASGAPLRKSMDDFLSEEKIRTRSIDYGLVTVEFPSMNPLYLWKEDIPKGKLFDFICASCAAFPAVHSYEIDGKSYIDGGYANNLPVSMAREKGAKFIIAVEIDRHDSEKVSPSPKDETYILIKPKHHLGNILNFQTAKSKRATILGYLDTLKAFSILDGDYYTFLKGQFTSSELVQVDASCKYFHLDPAAVYDRDSVNIRLQKAIKIYREKYTHAVENRLSTLISLMSFSSLKNVRVHGHLVLYILDSFKEYGENSIFATKHLMRIVPDEIRAAQYLINNLDYII